MKRLPTVMAALLACWACTGTAWPAVHGAEAAAAGAPSARAVAGAAPAQTAARAGTSARGAAGDMATKPAPGLQSLDAAGVAALVAPPAHGARLLALWALDCAYCEPNLAALAALQRAHPGNFELVTVATDPVTERTAIMARLQEAGVGNYPAYAYAEPVPERLNFLLDPRWGGETPRVLLIRADGSRLGISGELTPAQLKKLH